MNAKEILRKLNLMIIILLILCNFAIGQMEVFQVVPTERIPDILDTISTSVQENINKINSLEGEIQVLWRKEYKGEKAKRIFESRTNAVGDIPNRIAELTESTTTFSCDLNKGLYYTKASRESPSLYVDMSDDMSNNRDLGTKSMPWYSISILTPDNYLHSSPNRMRDGKVVQRRGVKEKAERDSSCLSNGQHSIFDPKNLINAGNPVWLHFPRIIERIKERGNYVVDEYSLRIEQGELDGKVQYRVHEPIKIGPEGDILWEIKTYSTDVGYNMISSKRTHTDGQLVNQRSIEYNSVQGVYFPKRIIYEVFDYNDGSLRSRKERTFKNIRLNAVIPPETFTYKNLSLTNGDVFIDKILEKEYTYQEGKLIEVEK